MRKSCGICVNGREITFSLSMRRHIPVDDNRIICIKDNSVHRKNREQKRCKGFCLKHGD